MMVFIIGLPRVGKTTFGKELARELDYPFIDLDSEILRRAHQETGSFLTIKELFLKEGEATFRQREEAALSLLGNKLESVVALGGGALISKKNQELVERYGKCIYLKVSEKTLADRLQENPLVFVKEGHIEAATKLSKERAQVFEKLADFTLDLTSISLKEGVAETVHWVHSLQMSKQPSIGFF